MLVPLLFFMYAIKATFFNQDFIYSKFIPASYEPVVTLLASQSATKIPDQQPVFVERIKTMLPKPTYEGILKVAADPFIVQIKAWVKNGIVLPAVIDLEGMRTNLKDEIGGIVKNTPACGPNEKSSEEFHFCKTTNLPAGDAAIETSIKNMIDKEVPQRLTLGDAKLALYVPIANKVISVIRYFNQIVFVIPLFMLFLIGLLVFEPWSLVLKKLGGTLISAGVSLLIVVIGIPSAIEAVTSTQQAILPAQKEFIIFIFNQPLFMLKYLTAITVGSGIVMYVAGRFFVDQDKTRTTKK